MNDVAMILILVWVMMANIVGYLLMGVDKRRAVRGAWRIPERTLFLAALLGGSLGSILGMRAYRHKTKHWQFRYGLPAILTVQVAVAVLVSMGDTFV